MPISPLSSISPNAVASTGGSTEHGDLFAMLNDSATKFRAIHTSRSISAFPAGRFGVTATAADGRQAFLVVQTENGPGHLGNVVPGRTVVDGFIAVVPDQAGFSDHGAGKKLNDSELRQLLVGLAKNHPGKNVVDFVAAVYSNGDINKLNEALHEANGPQAALQTPAVPNSAPHQRPSVGGSGNTTIAGPGQYSVDDASRN